MQDEIIREMAWEPRMVDTYERNCPKQITLWPSSVAPIGFCHRLACDILSAGNRESDERIVLRWQMLSKLKL